MKLKSKWVNWPRIGKYVDPSKSSKEIFDTIPDDLKEVVYSMIEKVTKEPNFRLCDVRLVEGLNGDQMLTVEQIINEIREQAYDLPK